MERATPPTGTNLHNDAPPYASDQHNHPSTPRPASNADVSDTEYDPTPLHSPGGPQYDDLPPSYNDALTDARNGVTPLDPSQLEAHRLTLNEGPDEPEVWEYRVRTEEPEEDDAPELAPAYGSHANDLASTVPVQHVANSETIPVGQVGTRSVSSPNVESTFAYSGNDPLTNLLNRALEFTHQQPAADAQFAPRLDRLIAIPQEERSDSSHGPVEMFRAYAEPLRAHSVQPAEFLEFLDGLNALCVATETSTNDLLHSMSSPDSSSNIVLDYVRGANEAFFAPRGLRVSLRSLMDVLRTVNVIGEPVDEKMYGIAKSILKSGHNQNKAQSLASFGAVATLESNVPPRSTRSQALFEASYRLRHDARSRFQTDLHDARHGATSLSFQQDPPHSIPGPTSPRRPYSSDGNRNTNRNTTISRAGPQEIDHSAPMGPWGPHGLFGPPGHGPFGRPGNGPFGQRGTGPFTRPGHSSGRQGGRGRGARGQRPDHPGASAPTNEWQALGQNMGKMGVDFGKMMGQWGQQFGQQAAAWGQEIGQAAQMRTGNAGSSGSASRSQPPQYDQAPRYDHPPQSDQPPHYDEAPPYAGPAGQDTGVHYNDVKVAPPSADSKAAGKQAVRDKDDDDDDDDDDDSDVSSISSDSTDSSDSSDSDDDAVTRSAKATRRAIRSSFKTRRRELNSEYRAKKRAIKASKAKGKGKGKATKSTEWKELKREYRAKGKDLKRQRAEARREWKKARREGKRAKKRPVVDAEDDDMSLNQVWVVVENLNTKC